MLLLVQVAEDLADHCACVTAACVWLHQVFKEERQSVRIDLHEGCGRTKLFWLIALADADTLKAMVEFRDTATQGTSSNNRIGLDVNGSNWI